MAQRSAERTSRTRPALLLGVGADDGAEPRRRPAGASRRAAAVLGLVLAAACSEPPSAPAPASNGASAPAKPSTPAVEAPAPAESPQPGAQTDAPAASAEGWSIPQPALARVPRGPDAVTLVEAGAEPREVARFALEPGQSRTVTLSMAMQVAMTLGTQSIDPSVLPVVEVQMDVTAKAPKRGAFPVSFEVTSAKRSELESASERLKKAMDTGVAGMADSKGSFAIDASGRRTAIDFGLPDVPTPGLRPSLAGFQQLFSQLFVVFPQEPVGVGASWTSTSHFELSGIPIEQRATYTLRAREGNELALDVSFEQSATGDVESPAGVALEDTQFGGTGTGSLTVRLDAPFPVTAQAQSRTRSQSSVTMGGGAQSVEMDLLSTLQISAPPA